MARVRVVLEVPDLGDGDRVGSRLVAEVLRAAGAGERIEVRTAGGQFVAEPCGARVLERAEGLVLNSVSDVDLDQALEDLHVLARQEFSVLFNGFPHGVGCQTLRRILAGVDVFFLTGEQRPATSAEAERIRAGLLTRIEPLRR